MILARSSKGTTLYVRGRDIEEGERAVIFGTENCRWTLLGDAAEVYRSDSRSKILKALVGAIELMGPAEIATATGSQHNNVDKCGLPARSSRSAEAFTRIPARILPPTLRSLRTKKHGPIH